MFLNNLFLVMQKLTKLKNQNVNRKGANHVICQFHNKDITYTAVVQFVKSTFITHIPEIFISSSIVNNTKHNKTGPCLKQNPKTKLETKKPSN